MYAGGVDGGVYEVSLVGGAGGDSGGVLGGGSVAASGGGGVVRMEGHSRCINALSLSDDGGYVWYRSFLLLSLWLSPYYVIAADTVVVVVHDVVDAIVVVSYGIVYCGILRHPETETHIACLMPITVYYCWHKRVSVRATVPSSHVWMRTSLVGDIMVSGSDDGTACVWDLRSRQALKVIQV